jgi:GDP/UDP-N,N'-diacetylbacillosamine 2-epimerase (hydrolysing)
MKIGVLTSSRADFGIYFPLLDLIRKTNDLELEIIAFGTHLREEYGYTVNEILNAGFEVKHQIKTPVDNDKAKDVSSSIGATASLFATFWEQEKFDLVFALGDRYEMFAAVAAASPFSIEIAHIHAGETTLGAIDNSYRHSISLMSKYLFVTTDTYKKRAAEIIENDQNVFNVGALSIDNLVKQELYSVTEFKDLFSIDMQIPSILITFHPETVNFKQNINYVEELIEALKVLKESYQLVITMPNSDTMGNKIREKLINFGTGLKEVKMIESFGMKGYLSCMKYCEFLLGNTSSGFVEAAFFPKKVINLGKRQEGRIITNNICTTEISKESILKAVEEIKGRDISNDTNVYGDGKASEKIINTLRKIYGFK